MRIAIAPAVTSPSPSILPPRFATRISLTALHVARRLDRPRRVLDRLARRREVDPDIGAGVGHAAAAARLLVAELGERHRPVEQQAGVAEARLRLAREVVDLRRLLAQERERARQA